MTPAPKRTPQETVALLTKENLYWGPQAKGSAPGGGITPAQAKKLVEEHLREIDLEKWVANERQAILSKRQSPELLRRQISVLQDTIREFQTRRECLREVHRLMHQRDLLKRELEQQIDDRDLKEFDALCAPFLEAWNSILRQERDSQNTPGQQRDERLAFLNQRKRELEDQLLIKVKKQLPITQVAPADVCADPKCRVALIHMPNGTDMVCPRCHTAYPYMDTIPGTNNAVSFKEEQDSTPSGGYNKSAHQEDLLKKVQGKGGKIVSDAQMMQIVNYLFEEGVRPEDLCSPPPNPRMAPQPTKEGIELIRKAMKDLKMNKNHLTQVYCRLTNCLPPHVSPEREEVLGLLFRLIEKGPYQKWKAIFDPKRNNFMSYTFSTRKFVELLNWEDLVPWFPLLKGEAKLHKQELIWEGICGDMGWKYIPSLQCFARQKSSSDAGPFSPVETGTASPQILNEKKSKDTSLFFCEHAIINEEDSQKKTKKTKKERMPRHPRLKKEEKEGNIKEEGPAVNRRRNTKRKEISLAAVKQEEVLHSQGVTVKTEPTVDAACEGVSSARKKAKRLN